MKQLRSKDIIQVYRSKNGRLKTETQHFRHEVIFSFYLIKYGDKILMFSLWQNLAEFFLKVKWEKLSVSNIKI